MLYSIYKTLSFNIAYRYLRRFHPKGFFKLANRSKSSKYKTERVWKLIFRTFYLKQIEFYKQSKIRE